MADENKEPRLRSFKKLKTALVCSSLCLAQNIILDLFLVHYHQGDHVNWAFVDVSVFVVLSSSEYYAMSVQLRQEQGEAIKLRNIFWMVWLLISSILCVKMAFIFMLFSHKLDETKVVFFGPNTLRTTILLSSVVFTLYLNCQYKVKINSYQHKLVTDFAGHVITDYMDAGDLLEILFNPLDRDLMPIRMHYIILAIVFYNMVLPSVTLYVLNKHNYGLIHLSLWRVYLYRMWLVLIINCPNLAIRIFLYTEYNAVISLMALKNLLMIIISIHEFHELSNDDYVDESLSFSSVFSATGQKDIKIDHNMMGKVYDTYITNKTKLLHSIEGSASAPAQVSRTSDKDARIIVSDSNIDIRSDSAKKFLNIIKYK